MEYFVSRGEVILMLVEAIGESCKIGSVLIKILYPLFWCDKYQNHGKHFNV